MFRSKQGGRPRASRLAGGMALATMMVLAAAASRAADDDPSDTQRSGSMSVETSPFGQTEDGQAVRLFTLANGPLTLKLSDYGATIVAVLAPDREGRAVNVTHGFPTLEGYLGAHPYFGSTVGRYANRIAFGRFRIGEQEYRLAANNGPHHLHGGPQGFHRAVWQAEEVRTDDAVGIKFTHTSPDGDEGYPGQLDVTALYLLTRAGEVRIEYSATTDAPTVVNLTNHAYWNLAGAGDIKGHELTLMADRYLPVDETLIPRGELTLVRDTPFDFTAPHKIGERLEAAGGDPVGYDHCYVLRSQDGSLALAARVVEPGSGRVMEVFTTQPGVQLYTGNFLDGKPNNGGFAQHTAFCLETQHYPDSPNLPQFPTTLLKPGQEYRQVTVYKFSVAERK